MWTYGASTLARVFLWADGRLGKFFEREPVDPILVS
jgi:hypothetical protein